VRICTHASLRNNKGMYLGWREWRMKLDASRSATRHNAVAHRGGTHPSEESARESARTPVDTPAELDAKTHAPASGRDPVDRPIRANGTHPPVRSTRRVDMKDNDRR